MKSLLLNAAAISVQSQKHLCTFFNKNNSSYPELFSFKKFCESQSSSDDQGSTVYTT